MKWRKLGRIHAPDGTIPWAKKYAYPATPLLMESGVLRLYAAFCDENTVGRVGYVEVDPADPMKVLTVSREPVLGIGAPGAFDENGVLPTTVIRVGDEIWMYYVGYQLGYKVRYFQFEGLAISRDGGQTFVRERQVPVLDRSDKEMLNRTSAFVVQDGGLFRCWYVGGSEWLTVNGKSLPTYNMRYLESPDGKTWGGEGRVCIELARPEEYALGRPWVMKEADRYRMFYSIRSRAKGYRLGYAESPDGVQWQRMDDKVGIDVSPSGWDSEMIEYPSIWSHAGRTYLFYNGNNCGETGFGCAVLD